MAKEYVIVKGKLVKMNENAFRIASRHFGATKNRPTEKAIPIELLRMPKLQIQPRIQPEVKVVEAQKASELAIEKVAEQSPVELQEKEPVKVTRRKR